MSERARFAMEWERRWKETEGQRVDMAELCRVFGVSRPTGYLWLRRYRDAGHDVRALADRASRPHASPTAVSEDMADFVVKARKKHPRWGPRMLRSWLIDQHPGYDFPSASTFANILKRRGLTTPRRRRRMRRRVPALAAPLGTAQAPNAIWCIDFKGDFLMGDGHRCYPFTVIDAFSRYCIRCESSLEISGLFVESVLDSAFREFGLPATIRSDNGVPFAANGPAGLSKLSVWLLRLGLRLERIAPGNPQQNGRLERFHRTLREATVDPPAASLKLQQRAFDLFRREYNEERPHQAIGNKPPTRFYVPSTKRYPRALVQLDYPDWNQLVNLDRDGTFRWHRHRIFVSSALAGQQIALFPDGGSRWLLRFGEIDLGRFDEHCLARPIKTTPRSRKPHFLELLNPDCFVPAPPSALQTAPGTASPLSVDGSADGPAHRNAPAPDPAAVDRDQSVKKVLGSECKGGP